MTWLSRLFPPASGVEGRLGRSHRTTRQRRRAMTVENLERRIVLSNVTTSVTGSTLTINADQFDDSFRIVESTSSGPDHGKVTVESTAPSTTINGSASAYKTPSAITAIKVKLVGATDSDVVELVGAGEDAVTTVKTVDFTVDKTFLTLHVHDVSNSGAFTLTTKGKLDALLADSTFSAVTIDQSQGCCVATVELDNVTTSGAAKIFEGAWSGDASVHDSVSIHDSRLGSTLIIQLDGDRNAVEVADSTVKELYVIQGSGDDDSVAVHGLRIASSGSGITIRQGDGDDDSATVDDVAVTGLITNRPVNVQSIYIQQGNGASDFASASNVTVGGHADIHQGDGAGDEASITDSYIGSAYPGYDNFGEATINQGHGAGDVAAIDGVVSVWAYITQGDGDEDEASITDSTVRLEAGIRQGNGGDVVSDADPDLIGDVATIDGVTGVYYDIYILQGDGDGDLASITNSDAEGHGGLLSSAAFFIAQGDGDRDFASISSVFASSLDIVIAQGDGDDDDAAIEFASAPDGNIIITQGDGDGDEAYIASVDVFFTILIHQGDGDGDVGSIDGSSTALGNIYLVQGDGDRDSATVSNSLSAWDIRVLQGDGILDTASVLDSTALGYSEPVYDQAGNILYYIDLAGEINIGQGDGYGDWAIVDGIYAGADYTATSIEVDQGNNIATPDCDGFPGDTVFINDAIVVSDIRINQGYQPYGDAAPAVGGYSVYIAAGVWDRDGAILFDPADVVAGGRTYVYQYGGGNTVVMGSDGSAFATVYLDVYTGDDGGGFVMATNVTVDWGSFYGLDFSIDGGGDGNVYFDAGGNSGFTASDNYSTVTP